MKFGKLRMTNIKRVPKQHTLCTCLCDCGCLKDYKMTAVVSGNTSSCGCVRYENNILDRLGGKAIFSTWDNIKGRCFRPRNDAYKWYGAKGITMCEEWKDSFDAFYTWSISNGWSEGLVLDKDELSSALDISPAIYSPETCQWVTRAYNLQKGWM